MGRHNPVASRRRRLPYVAKIKRGDPFCPEDEREIEGMCKRIAAAGEFMALAGWRDDAGYRVFHFGTWAKARAMRTGSTIEVQDRSSGFSRPASGTGGNVRRRTVVRSAPNVHMVEASGSTGTISLGKIKRAAV